MNPTQDLFFSKQEFNLESLGKQKTEIDFDQIEVEKEYFFTECQLEEKSAKYFLGENEESTEINSLLSPLNSTTSDLFKRCQTSQENTETEEILAILRKKSSPTILENSYSRTFSKSSPQFYEAKKVTMKGRVIECKSGEQNFETGSPIPVSNFSLPIQSLVPVRPKCIPRRSITGTTGFRLLPKNESTSDILESQGEKNFNL
jgi:hypothetical protein